MKKWFLIRVPVFFLLLVCSFIGSKLPAQTPGLENQDHFKVHIHKTNEAIKIDGDLNEVG